MSFLDTCIQDSMPIWRACLPCMLGYGWIFGELLKTAPGVLNTPFGRFVSDYAGNYYETLCRNWSAFTDQACRDLSQERRTRCLKVFRACSEHEYNFWIMSARPRTDLP